MDREIQKEMDRFVALFFLLDQEEVDAVNGFIPMTQKIYDHILDKCMGEPVEEFFQDMLFRYPEFMTVHARRLEG